MQALADSIVLSCSGRTRLVDRMEREGLVRRDQSPEDRQSYYATITADGVEALRRARVVHHHGIQEHFERHLDDGELQALRRLLEKVSSGGDTSPD